MHGCRLQRYDKDSHLEIRININNKASIKPPTIILCKKHLSSICEDVNHQMLGYKRFCALCGDILDINGFAVSIDLEKIVSPAYVNEPVDYILYNFKAMSTYVVDHGYDYLIADFIATCASFLESTPYSCETISISHFAYSLDNIGNSIYYLEALEWFIDLIASVNYYGNDKMTIFGLTYSDLKIMVGDYIIKCETYTPDNITMVHSPYWNNTNTSCFVVHKSCVCDLLSRDWNAL